MDSKEPSAEIAAFNLDIARAMVAAAEEAWHLPRIWFACWWNVVVDSCWPPRDFGWRE
jgi:hypothetical protein